MIARRTWLLLLALTLAGGGPSAWAQGNPLVTAFDEALTRGDLPGAEKQATDSLAANPRDDTARFALGTVQFLRAVEARMQAFHRHGYQPTLLNLIAPTNLPIPPNPKPEPIDAAKARALVQAWVDDLARVEATLAPIQAADVKLTLHFGQVRLDFNGDGRRDDSETLGTLYLSFRGDRPVEVPAEPAAAPPLPADADESTKRQRERERVQAEQTRSILQHSKDERDRRVMGIQKVVVSFDRGDVDWLRGYTHLLSAPAEFLLAHDFGPWFSHSGSVFFAGAKPPEPFLAVTNRDLNNQENFVPQILDLVAALHMLRLPVVEPARMKSAHAHLKAMVDLSRSTWKLYGAETDDDHEWIPNPNQTASTGARVTGAMVQGWQEFLDEFAAILDGKTLLPFWRGKPGEEGINLRRVFEEPRDVDLILWVQGASAAPYLEAGPITRPETWQRMSRIFHGEFIGFALWFN